MAPSWVYCQKICADNRCREEAAVLVPVSELRRLQIAARPSLKPLLLSDDARADGARVTQPLQSITANVPLVPHSNLGDVWKTPFCRIRYGEEIPENLLIEGAMTAAAVRLVAIKIEDDMKARVKRLADARQRTPHWLMREALTQYVDREEKREAFRQDSLKAWETFRATGLDVSADEADAWMPLLEQGHDIEPPKCHD